MRLSEDRAKTGSWERKKGSASTIPCHVLCVCMYISSSDKIHLLTFRGTTSCEVKYNRAFLRCSVWQHKCKHGSVSVHASPPSVRTVSEPQCISVRIRQEITVSGLWNGTLSKCVRVWVCLRDGQRRRVTGLCEASFCMSYVRSLWKKTEKH